MWKILWNSIDVFDVCKSKYSNHVLFLFAKNKTLIAMLYIMRGIINKHVFISSVYHFVNHKKNKKIQTHT